MTTMTKKKKKQSMKVSSSSSSSGLIDIPNDVIRHILSLLSARYLMRLRWVCKYWFNLITHDLSFINMHLHDHQQSVQHYPTILIHNPETYSEGIIQYNYDDDDAWEGRRRRCPLNIKLYDHPAQKHEYKVLGSCNGLLLMSLFSRTSPDQGRESTFLWNPCTKEFKTLPDIPIEEEEDKMNSEFQIYGFGYDCIIDDYKVISVCNSKRYDETVMAIYTLGTNSWRRVGGFPRYKLHMIRARTLCNGALYSFAWNSMLRRDVLLSFDIVKEECKEITKMLPKPTCIRYDNHNFGEFKGCLCLFITLWNSSNKINLELWRLMKDEHSSGYTGESWTKLYTITRQKFTPAITKWLQPLRICNNGEILMMVNQKDVVWYNPKDDKIRFVATVSGSPNFNTIFNTTVTAPIGIYIESLVSLKTGTYMGQEQLRRRRRVGTKEEEKNHKKKKKSC